MIINHNVTALNTHNKLSAASAAQSKSMEKLASGLRINKAGDDAAGLAISEKMRAQVRGLDQAGRNAQDGISMIQTAEGALNETHDILQRMRELAVQSGNDTNTDADRVELQKENDQLAKEITRIANNTEFNTKSLLNGAVDDNNVKAAVFQIGANQDQNLKLDIKAMDAASLGVARSVTAASLNSGTDVTSVSIGAVKGTGVAAGSTLTLSSTATPADTTWSESDLGITGTSLASTTNSSTYNDYKIIVSKTGSAGADVTAALDSTNKTITLNYASNIDSVNTSGTATKLQAALDNAGIALTASGDATAVTASATTGVGATTDGLASDELRLSLTDGTLTETTVVKSNAKSVSFTEASKFKGIDLTLDGSLSGTAASITIAQSNSTSASFANNTKTSDATVAGGIDISSQASANTAITSINKAIETVSAERSKLGANQNRLEHTINNLKTSSENLTAAESRVRDVDMAKEMMTQTKNSILAQAAQAMLAQSNQTPQGVLQLLR